MEGVEDVYLSRKTRLIPFHFRVWCAPLLAPFRFTLDRRSKLHARVSQLRSVAWLPGEGGRIG